MKIITRLNAESFRNAADYQRRTLAVNYAFSFHIKRGSMFDGGGGFEVEREGGK